MAKNIKEMFELNRKCEISFENSKIHALSPQGTSWETISLLTLSLQHKIYYN